MKGTVEQRKESTSPPAPLRDGEGRRKMGGEETPDVVKDPAWMAQDQVIGKTKDDETGSGEPSVAATVT